MNISSCGLASALLQRAAHLHPELTGGVQLHLRYNSSIDKGSIILCSCSLFFIRESKQHLCNTTTKCKGTVGTKSLIFYKSGTLILSSDLRLVLIFQFKAPFLAIHRPAFQAIPSKLPWISVHPLLQESFYICKRMNENSPESDTNIFGRSIQHPILLVNPLTVISRRTEGL